MTSLPKVDLLTSAKMSSLNSSLLMTASLCVLTSSEESEAWVQLSLEMGTAIMRKT